jgi:thymidylate synthase ThyX
MLTHRLFSRNSSSSRAIPSERLIQQVIDDPVLPVFWGKNQAGMQAREELGANDYFKARELWLAARNEAVASVRCLHAAGLHKQLANRLLEPWMWITVIISATDFDNFFALRCHPDAQPEIQKIAKMMRESYERSVPHLVTEEGANGWHLPFLKIEDYKNNPLHTFNDLRKLSVARCARVSYLTHDGQHDPEVDLMLHDRLAASGHWSPFEHVAEAAPGKGSGNFQGWEQYRKMFRNEHLGRKRP